MSSQTGPAIGGLAGLTLTPLNLWFGSSASLARTVYVETRCPWFMHIMSETEQVYYEGGLSFYTYVPTTF